MKKLLEELYFIEDVPKEAVNIVKLIDYKQSVDKFFTKAKVETFLDNLSKLENVLSINNIKNEKIDRQISIFKNMLYKEQQYFINQERFSF